AASGLESVSRARVRPAGGNSREAGADGALVHRLGSSRSVARADEDDDLSLAGAAALLGHAADALRVRRPAPGPPGHLRRALAARLRAAARVRDPDDARRDAWRRLT